METYIDSIADTIDDYTKIKIICDRLEGVRFKDIKERYNVSCTKIIFVWLQYKKSLDDILK